MEQVIRYAASPRVRWNTRPAFLRRAVRALHAGVLAALAVLLGAFVAGYPLLRLGLLGPVPEGYAIEMAVAVPAAVLGALALLLEGAAGGDGRE